MKLSELEPGNKFSVIGMNGRLEGILLFHGVGSEMVNYTKKLVSYDDEEPTNTPERKVRISSETEVEIIE